MARFMDFHEDLQLAADAIAQLAEDATNATTSCRSSATTATRWRSGVHHAEILR